MYFISVFRGSILTCKIYFYRMFFGKLQIQILIVQHHGNACMHFMVVFLEDTFGLS